MSDEADHRLHEFAQGTIIGADVKAAAPKDQEGFYPLGTEVKILFEVYREGTIHRYVVAGKVEEGLMTTADHFDDLLVADMREVYQHDRARREESRG